MSLLIFSAINGLIIVVIGFTVLVRKWRLASSWSFFLSTFFLALWIIVLSLYESRWNSHYLLLYSRVVFASGVAWVIGLYNFLIEFPELIYPDQTLP